MLPEDFRYPIEGRHLSWFSEDAISYLKTKKLCLVWNHISGIENPMPITSDFLYLRLIGDRSIPDSDFGKVTKNREDEIKQWSEKLEDVSDVPLAMVMINNHFEGFGPATANSLRMNLGMRELDLGRKNAKDT